MLRAIILDFNGVILDDEPLHFAAMRTAVAHFGINLNREEYWDKYLPLDDTRCLEAIFRDYSIRLKVDERTAALECKIQTYSQLLQGRIPLFPGAARFIQTAAGRYPLALASGARREEIKSVLDSTGLKRYFLIVLAAEDFARGKPHPESFLLALERLNAALNPPPILPEECLVVEDSIGCIQGARAAGMACMAVANSYERDKLRAAQRVVASLEEVTPDSLQALFEEPV
jgi:beta-phosphoglucomutase